MIERWLQNRLRPLERRRSWRNGLGSLALVWTATAALGAAVQVPSVSAAESS